MCDRLSLKASYTLVDDAPDISDVVKNNSHNGNHLTTDIDQDNLELPHLE